jgi:hypothetical protein
LLIGLLKICTTIKVETYAIYGAGLTGRIIFNCYIIYTECGMIMMIEEVKKCLILSKRFGAC